jgi:hypothetical protein
MISHVFLFEFFVQCTLSVYTGLPSVAGGIKQFSRSLVLTRSSTILDPGSSCY